MQRRTRGKSANSTSRRLAGPGRASARPAIRRWRRSYPRRRTPANARRRRSSPSPGPADPSACGKRRRTDSSRWISSRSRSVLWARSPVASGRLPASGGGGGGGSASRWSSTHLPRSTGEVRSSNAVTASTLPWARMPACRSVGKSTRTKSLASPLASAGRRRLLLVNQFRFLDAVVLGEPRVHEAVVRRQQRRQRPIVANRRPASS